MAKSEFNLELTFEPTFRTSFLKKKVIWGQSHGATRRLSPSNKPWQLIHNHCPPRNAAPFSDKKAISEETNGSFELNFFLQIDVYVRNLCGM